MHSVAQIKFHVNQTHVFYLNFLDISLSIDIFFKDGVSKFLAQVHMRPKAHPVCLQAQRFVVILSYSVILLFRPLSFSEFTIVFGRYTEIVCSVFPHRWRELNDYLAIVAELVLSYGGAHFYTYHKLFSAKCAVRVSQWNQCPYWGALDSDLHNRVFFSCRNLSCTVCRSVAHSTISCPQVNPAIIPCPEPTQVKSTSYLPRSTTTNPISDSRRESISFSGNQQVCGNFNRGRCVRQQCKYLHVCSYCGGAHARTVCPVIKATNKQSRNYLSTPVNISFLSSELSHHPDTNFTSYLLSGLKQGFNPGTTCPLSHNIICNNLQ